MEKHVIQTRLEQLRKGMKEAELDFYLIPTTDYHHSEYVNQYFKVREYFSGFSGSNGTLVVSAEDALLWTDGRYFVQAEKELSGTGIRLMRMGEEEIPSIEDYLDGGMEEGQILGFDGRTVEASYGGLLEKKLSVRSRSVRYEMDLAGPLWLDRPALPCGFVKVLDEHISGMSLCEKIGLVRKKMEEEKTEAFLLNKLDDIMWLLNIRGSDVPCNPVALSYVWMTQQNLHVFLQNGAVNPDLKNYFKENNVIIEDYHHILQFLKEQKGGQRILADVHNISYLLYKTIEQNQVLIETESPIEMLKAVKNPVELKNMEAVYIRDSAALTKFIYWIKKNHETQDLDELEAAAYLNELRSRIEGYLDLSFPTISAFGENAAMCHYETKKSTSLKLQKPGFYLVDSGGQYLGGTTDVTRTIALGQVSEEMKHHFTAVACGMLRLSGARFLEGCTGRNLDILAREPLWNCDLDFKHGTGHGIGYILNVHEGLQSIRWQYSRTARETVLEAGMVVSNEPGIYLEGRYGIRTENIMTVVKGKKNEYGQFLHFDTLTWVPIDKEALDIGSMTQADVERLNTYHRQVYEKISPFLESEEKEWLKEVTAPYF